jgi:hypothetical protein
LRVTLNSCNNNENKYIASDSRIGNREHHSRKGTDSTYRAYPINNQRDVMVEDRAARQHHPSDADYRYNSQSLEHDGAPIITTQQQHAGYENDIPYTKMVRFVKKYF